MRHTLTYTSKLTVRGGYEQIDKKIISIFPLWTFHFLHSNITAAPAYEVYISQLMRFARACSSYYDFFDIGLQIRRLLNQGFLLVKLTSSLRNIYGRHHDLVDRYLQTLLILNHISGVMASVPTSNVVDREFEPRSGKPKDYNWYLLLLR
jgi:hypothetical protein